MIRKKARAEVKKRNISCAAPQRPQKRGMVGRPESWGGNKKVEKRARGLEDLIASGV